MTEYERAKRESHVIAAICVASDCPYPEHEIRASMDPVRYWGVDRPVHQECFDRHIIARQRSGGTVVQAHIAGQ